MQLATGGKMLNFGYWNENTKNPLQAQDELCLLVAKLAELSSAKIVIDVGSGFSAPAMYWKSLYNFLCISCVNINFHQLKSPTSVIVNNVVDHDVTVSSTDDISLVNATSTTLPLSDHCADRVIALESAQHFKPLTQFIQESKRILKQDGCLVIAMPVTTGIKQSSFTKLGILSLTWSSEHYDLDSVKSVTAKEGFQIDEIQKIGSHVYEPLTNYYIKNRETLRQNILREYPSYLESILYKSLLKMKDASKNGIIDYVLLKCSPTN